MEILNQLNQLISQESILKIKNNIFLILNKIGFNELFFLINRKKLIILIYHGITDHEHFINPYHIPKSMFIKQMKYLIRKKYKFINLTDWLKIIKNNKKIKEKYVILTFDDGFKSVIKNAYPIIKKLGIKGCLYIVSDLIGKDQFLWTDYINVFIKNFKNSKFQFIYKNMKIQYSLNSEKEKNYTTIDIISKLGVLNNKERFNHLNQFGISNNINNFQEIPQDYLIANWEEIKNLDNNIIEIGSHSKTHPQLIYLESDNEFYQELYESKNIIEKELRYTIKHFCYPHGSYNEKIIQLVKNYGYLTSVTIIRGFNTRKTDLFQLKRIMGYRDFILFKSNISGLYIFLKKFFIFR